MRHCNSARVRAPRRALSHSECAAVSSPCWCCAREVRHSARALGPACGDLRLFAPFLVLRLRRCAGAHTRVGAGGCMAQPRAATPARHPPTPAKSAMKGDARGAKADDAETQAKDTPTPARRRLSYSIETPQPAPCTSPQAATVMRLIGCMTALTRCRAAAVSHTRTPWTGAHFSH